MVGWGAVGRWWGGVGWGSAGESRESDDCNLRII